MSMIQDVNKFNAGTQIINWKNSCNSAIEQVEHNRNSISGQLELMRTNSDYTADDILEVEELLNDINLKIANLNG